MVELVIKLQPGVLANSARFQAISESMARLRAPLEQPDSAGQIDYTVAMIGSDIAGRVLEQVRKLDGVETAFVKARGETP